MKILIVTHYFPPETGAPQARLSGLAAAWAAGGDEVTVLTGMPNHPTGVIPSEYRGAIRRRERRDGYRVLRTWLYATPNEGVARKTIGHLSFTLTGVLLGGRASGPADVVVVSSPTFFSIGAGWLLARLKLTRRPLPRPAPGPLGMREMSEVRAGKFRVMGYAGQTAEDHVAQFESFPWQLRLLW